MTTCSKGLVTAPVVFNIEESNPAPPNVFQGRRAARRTCSSQDRVAFSCTHRSVVVEEGGLAGEVGQVYPHGSYLGADGKVVFVEGEEHVYASF